MLYKSFLFVSSVNLFENRYLIVLFLHMLVKLNHLLNRLLCFKLLEKTSNKFLQSVLFFLLILQVQSNITLFNFLPYLLKTDIDDCASHPCKNNGSCSDRVNGFNCSCAAGFNGTQCETGHYMQYLYSFIRYCCCLFYST